jgi:hypothetical protein
MDPQGKDASSHRTHPDPRPRRFFPKQEFQLMTKQQSSSRSGQHGSQRNSQNTSNASRSHSSGSHGAPGRSQSGHSQQASTHRRASSEEEE